MGLESAPQSPLGRIDPSMVVPRSDPSLNSPSATAAMIDAFRSGQITANEIADRALKHPAMVQAVKDATDPEQADARKRALLANASSAQSEAGSAALALQQQQELANIPQFIRGPYLELVKANMAPPVDLKKWDDAATTAVIDSFGKLMDYHREVIKAKTLKDSTQPGEVAVKGGTQMVTVSKATQAPVNPAATQAVENWNLKYQASPQTWIRDGMPAVHSDLFSAPGTTITSAGITGVESAPASGGRLIKSDADRPKTEIQTRAVGFITRAHETNRALANLKKEKFDPTTFGKYTLNSAANIWGLGALEALKTEEMKAYNTAASAWTVGLLRVESGATVTPKEGLEASKGFFPQVSDPPSVQQQKARLRAAMERAMTAIASGDAEAINDVIAGKEQAKAFEDQHQQIASGAPVKGNQRRTLNGRQGTLVPSPEGLRFVPDAPGSIVQSSTNPPTIYDPKQTLRKPIVQGK